MDHQSSLEMLFPQPRRPANGSWNSRLCARESGAEVARYRGFCPGSVGTPAPLYKVRVFACVYTRVCVLGCVCCVSCVHFHANLLRVMLSLRPSVARASTLVTAGYWDAILPTPSSVHPPSPASSYAVREQVKTRKHGQNLPKDVLPAKEGTAYRNKKERRNTR